MQVVGVNGQGLFGGDTPTMVERFVEQTGVTFPVGWDRSDSYDRFARAVGGGLSPYPIDVVVGPEGRIRFLDTRFDPEAMAGAIEEALADVDGAR